MPTWTTAYLAALAEPEYSLAFFPPPRSFRDQTVRQLVRLRRGGSAVRLVLSNEFGRSSLVLDRVAADGRPALLAGAARWEIPPGGTATSDPMSLPVTAGKELVVDLYVVSATDPATYLHSAQRIGEVAPGDQAGATSLTWAEPFVSAFWLARVLVDAHATGPVVIALGDSITRGDGTSIDLEQRYPDHLQRRLVTAGVSGAAVLNAGIGGNRLLRRRVGPPLTDRFERDVLEVSDATHVIISAGVNDIGMPGAFGGPLPKPGDLADGLLGLAARAQRHGVRPLVATITPFGGGVYSNLVAPGNEEIRRGANDALRAQRDVAVVDFAAALADPADDSRLAALYDSGDGVHPGDAGAAAMAAAVDLALLTPDAAIRTA